MHADAGTVVIHADADPVDGTWEITVADDGRGFDPAATPRGFGLGTRPARRCTAMVTTADVRSFPGEGTTVILRGPVEERP
ncbi:ATP-binding protein [Yinghuangia aomiensis]